MKALERIFRNPLKPQLLNISMAEIRSSSKPDTSKFSTSNDDRKFKNQYGRIFLWSRNWANPPSAVVYNTRLYRRLYLSVSSQSNNYIYVPDLSSVDGELWRIYVNLLMERVNGTLLKVVVWHFTGNFPHKVHGVRFQYGRKTSASEMAVWRVWHGKDPFAISVRNNTIKLK